MIAGTETAMAVVPLGTGNAWAIDLGIPVGAQQTARALANASVKAIDVGTANGRVFVNVATIGLTSLIAKNLQGEAKGRFGKFAYFPAVWQSMREVRPFRIHVKTSEQEFDDTVLQFVAAAGRTHAGPFPVTRHAENDDGLLSLYSLHAVGRPGLVRFGWALILGRHTALDEVWCCETSSAEVVTRPRKKVIVDGEVIGRTPLSLSIRPGALRVLVPDPGMAV
jgi:diacylglycerol kinase family enzyme